MTNESLNQGVDEDIELRELLISNLESRGILSKIKADLRAAIFQCLDEKSTHQLLSAEETQIPLSLCCDLLDKLGLLSTSKVNTTLLGCSHSELELVCDLECLGFANRVRKCYKSNNFESR